MTELSFSSPADLIAAVSLVSMGSTVLRAWMVCLPWAEYGRGLTEAPPRCSGLVDVRSGAAPSGGRGRLGRGGARLDLGHGAGAVALLPPRNGRWDHRLDLPQAHEVGVGRRRDRGRAVLSAGLREGLIGGERGIRCLDLSAPLQRLRLGATWPRLELGLGATLDLADFLAVLVEVDGQIGRAHV